jgi:hypothetical protein
MMWCDPRGRRIAAVLARLGSVRCHDCRSGGTVLRSLTSAGPMPMALPCENGPGCPSEAVVRCSRTRRRMPGLRRPLVASAGSPGVKRGIGGASMTC